MSVLAPIICDNGTGYSKVGYVVLQISRSKSPLSPREASQETLILPCTLVLYSKSPWADIEASPLYLPVE